MAWFDYPCLGLCHTICPFFCEIQGACIVCLSAKKASSVDNIPPHPTIKICNWSRRDRPLDTMAFRGSLGTFSVPEHKRSVLFITQPTNVGLRSILSFHIGIYLQTIPQMHVILGYFVGDTKQVAATENVQQVHEQMVPTSQVTCERTNSKREEPVSHHANKYGRRGRKSTSLRAMTSMTTSQREMIATLTWP